MDIDIETLLLLLSAILGLSLVVERILEGVKSLIRRMLMRQDSSMEEKENPVESMIGEMAFKKVNNKLDDLLEEIEETQVKLKQAGNQQMEKYREKVHSLEEQAAELIKRYNDRFKEQVFFDRKQSKDIKRKKQYLEARLKDGRIDKSWGEFDEKFYQPTVIVDQLGSPDAEQTARIFWLQIIGAVGGILICHFSELGIFMYLVDGVSPQLDWILTGILIGGGSQPIHTLIKFIQSRKAADLAVSNESEVETEEESETKAEKKQPPAREKKPSAPIIDIKYRGGFERDHLENIHFRKANPDLIIYHHTAMHSDTTFADVVKVIKDRGWSTGYNCVVLKDGSIHPFCRWDRYGNHAKGYNRRSLGIALNGNFETNPHVPFANVDGKYGIKVPTEEQLRSVCRVVVLWCFLYDISLDFEKSIIPHNKIAAKACPGSNFPYAEFQRQVTAIYDKWKSLTQAQEELAQYEKKPYLFV